MSNVSDSLQILIEGTERMQGREFQSSLTEHMLTLQLVITLHYLVVFSHSPTKSGIFNETLAQTAPASHCPCCHPGLALYPHYAGFQGHICVTTSPTYRSVISS